MAQKYMRQFVIVGIGASAGGLAPLKKFVQSLPEKTGMSYVIVQHLDPDHESLLSDILSRESKMLVKHAEHGELLQADTFYVIPPDVYLELEGQKIMLSQLERGFGSRKAIDHFFRSLAREWGDACAGIVMSGSGSDGTAGLRAIKAAGGLVLAQDPEDAEHPSMPQSAIDAAIVDKVVSVGEMHDLLQQYADHPQTMRYMESRSEPPNQGADSAEKSLSELAAILKTHEEFDLTLYKPTTIQRRVSRRMSLTGTEKYEKYLQLLRDSESERKCLTKDLLVNVTDFFRDPEAFELLENKVIPSIIESVKADDDIRVWVVGCASGEEAYSVAILLVEAVERRQLSNGIKVYATDIDEYAIKIARRGVYPDSIAAEVPEKFLDKYFVRVKNDHCYRIKNTIRDLISFATHNVASQPPFNHMHLVSCRNLLIYLNKDVQQRVIASFYFALEESSYLFLGSSETLGERATLFKTLSKKWRIYRKIPGDNKNHVLMEDLKFGATNHQGPTLIRQHRRPRSAGRTEQIRKAILDTQAPATLVVNQEGSLLYYHGELAPFCVPPAGEPRNELIQIIQPALRSRIRSAFYKVKKSGEPLSFHCALTTDEDRKRSKVKKKRIVQVKIVPIGEQDFTDGTAYTISFIEAGPAGTKYDNSQTRDDDNKATAELEQELQETREELQNTIEELETSSEELKASHEEALSSNEELQSSNEELEASAEELRSLNEELSTVNTQLKTKIDELRRAHNDVENFFASTDLPTLFLDPELNIQRCTPAAELLLRIGTRDIGKPVSALPNDLIDENVTEDCREVLQNFQPRHREVRDYRGRWFIRQITPYRTEERRIEGVVLVFQDVTNLKNLSERAQAREKQQAVVARLGLQALSGMEPDELMHQGVRQLAHVLDVDFCKVLKLSPGQDNFLLIAGVGWTEGLVGRATVKNDRRSQAGYTLLTNEPVITTNLKNEKRFTGPDLLLDHQIVSGMSCVINHTNPPFGVLGVHSRQDRVFTEEDTNFLQSIANIFSVALRTKVAQERLASNEERLNIARDAAQLGIHDYDVVNDSIVWDENHRRMWGVADDAPVNYQVFERGLHPDDRERVNREVSEALNAPGKYTWSFRVVNIESGKTLNIAATGRVVHQEGRAVRIVGTVQDVTEREKLEISLQRAINDLRTADHRKNEFLSILGHELRNPLASLSNSIEIFDQSKLPDDRLLSVMRHSIETMSRLLDDLLDLNRVSENKVELDVQSLNIKDILQIVYDQTERVYSKKNQSLTLDIGENVMVNGDQKRLEQIFTNIIVNASKYTPAGGVVTVTAVAEKSNVKVTVGDNGIGLTAEELHRVFDPFYQVKPEQQASQGLGIGLALARRLVDLHGGEITAESAGPGRGATFTVRLPRAKRDKENPDKKGLNTAREIRAGLKVLLIEDNQEILATMSILLDALGCDVATADTGVRGIEQVNIHSPDAMLIDIGLPDISGHDVAEKLRAAGYEGLLIALSGYGHTQAREKSHQVGFNFHLAKPARIEEIKNILANCE